VNILSQANPIARRTLKIDNSLPVRPGERTDAAGKAIGNVILLSVPDAEYALLRPGLEPVDLPQYQILH